jgi:hypothetical protein
MLKPDLALTFETPSLLAAEPYFNSAAIAASSSELSAWSSSAAAS